MVIRKFLSSFTCITKVKPLNIVAKHVSSYYMFEKIELIKITVMNYPNNM